MLPSAGVLTRVGRCMPGHEIFLSALELHAMMRCGTYLLLLELHIRASTYMWNVLWSRRRAWWYILRRMHAQLAYILGWRIEWAWAKTCMHWWCTWTCFLNVNVKTVQFDTILNEPSVIIIQMRVNTCLPESVPHIIPPISDFSCMFSSLHFINYTSWREI